MAFDRQLLLLGEKRNQVLDLSEVRQYGLDSYVDPDYVSLFGLRPQEWFDKGIRVLGRTAVECTRDRLANLIGSEISSVARATGQSACLVLDLFAGSANTLYWILHHLPGAVGLAFESEPQVFRLTERNLELLGLPLTVLNVDYADGLAHTPSANGKLIIAFIAPPWGAALHATKGLDLRLTQPPVTEIVDRLVRQFAEIPLLCAIQVYQQVEAESLAAVERLFDWTTLKIYRINRDGENHGLLIGSKGWVPDTAPFVS